MTTVNIYLNFNGNCFEAFTFYKSVFGGEFPYVGYYKDMPPQEGCEPMTAEDGEKIMHMSLPISAETMLMGSDAGGEWAAAITQGNNFTISINTDSQAEAVTMPLANTFWGDYFGMFTDQFGINWMVSFATKK
jgi:PhnB protein